MTAEELAKLLNGMEYGKPIPYVKQAKEDNLVIVMGYSDDGIDFSGAINDEYGASDGAVFKIHPIGGILKDWEDYEDITEKEAEAYFKFKGRGSKFTAWFGKNNTTWTYDVDFKHYTFNVMEDGEIYSIGFVFSLNDLPV